MPTSDPRLIPKYTFDNFVVGQSNRFAHAAALAETRQFEEAVRTARQAADLARQAGQDDLARAIHQRARSYQANRPWRETR